MNKNFIYVREGESLECVENLMDEKGISQIPILNNEHKIVGLFLRNFNLLVESQETPVFLLAGGLGTRLRPLTDNYPKPMIEIADRPILEHIILEFARQGFRNIYISINFKGEIIKDFFGDGKKWGVKIQYVEENQRLGTAGSLSLIQNLNIDNILVMNGDLLTQVNFKKLLDYHFTSDAYATVCSRAYTHEVPFGVLLLDKTKVIGIHEKPVITKMMSTGIYVLKKNCLDKLEYDTFCDMPELIEKLINEHLPVTSFETKDNWIDIGRLSDLERARNTVYAKVNK